MTASAFRSALCALALGLTTLLGAGPAPLPVRPIVTSLTITLDDGRTYSVTPQQLADPQGGAVFWGDWAVANILVPHHANEPRVSLSPSDVHNLWNHPGASGQLPAFLLNTAGGPVYPLDPGGPTGRNSGPRPQIQSIQVGYADGRSHFLSQLALRDGRSGVIVWNDFAVATLFIPFYFLNPGLPTRPYDVLRIWNQPVAPVASTSTAATELPAYMVKPQCMPIYPSAD